MTTPNAIQAKLQKLMGQLSANNQRLTLEQKMKDAEQDNILSGPKMKQAQRNYYVYTMGLTGYNNKLANEVSVAAEKEYNDWALATIAYLDQATAIMNATNLADDATNTIDELNTLETDAYNKFISTVSDTESDATTDERKVYYASQQISELQKIYSNVLWVIYVLLIITFVVTKILAGVVIGLAGYGILALTVFFLYFLPYITFLIIRGVVFIGKKLVWYIGWLFAGQNWI